MRRSVAVLCMACGAAAVVAATQAPGQLPTFRADTRLVEVSVVVHDKSGAPVAGLTQTVYAVPQEKKTDLFLELLKDNTIYSAIAFTRTKARANRLAAALEKHRIPSDLIHGDRSQSQRTRALEDFKRGKHRVLVATDIAARGLDIIELGHVVNYDVPRAAEDYMHRIGRTARAQSTGDAITFVSSDEEPLMKQIEYALGKRLDRSKNPLFPDASLAPPKAQVVYRSRPRRR